MHFMAQNAFTVLLFTCFWIRETLSERKPEILDASKNDFIEIRSHFQDWHVSIKVNIQFCNFSSLLVLNWFSYHVKLCLFLIFTKKEPLYTGVVIHCKNNWICLHFYILCLHSLYLCILYLFWNNFRKERNIQTKLSIEW